MKKLGILVMILSVCLVQNLTGQKFEISKADIKYEKNQYPTIQVILEPETDEVKDAWEDFIKDEYDVKMKGTGFLTNKDVLYAEQVKFDAISSKEMDFYTRIVEEGDHTVMNVFGSFGYDIPVSEKEYPLEYSTMENITKRFLQSYLPKYYKEWIGKTEEKLSDLKDEKKDMEEELKENEEEISKLEKRNKELDKMLKDKSEEIESTVSRLEEKKSTFNDVTSRLNQLRINQ